VIEMFLSDYQCEVCAHTWEELTTTKEEYPEGCPNCKEHNITRILGGTTKKLNDPEAVASELKRRSAKHTEREIKKNFKSYKGSLSPEFAKGKGKIVGL